MNLYHDAGVPQSKVGCYICGEYHTGLTLRGLMAFRLAEAEKKMTSASYRQLKWMIEQHILPELGDYEIDYLTQADIDDFLQKKREGGRKRGSGGLSESMVQGLARALRTAFKLVRWEVSADTEFVDAPHLKPLDEMLTLEQADILTKYLTQNLDRCNAGFLLCLYTGIKMSEVCSLKDSDFDLENDYIHIQRTMLRAVEGKRRSSTFATVEYPEDYYGKRFLKLPLKLSTLLWSLLRQTKEDVYFLSGKTEGSISPRTYQERFKSILPDAGLPDELNFHMLRNTFAWMWLLRDKDLEGLTYVMGYKSVQGTVFTYSALLENLHVRLPGCAKFLSLPEPVNS